jgi:hypothetical protein
MTITNNYDIRTVDKNILVDAADVQIDLNAPVSERMVSTVRQMNGNPYFFKSGGIAVMVSHMDTSVSLNERIESYMQLI